MRPTSLHGFIRELQLVIRDASPEEKRRLREAVIRQAEKAEPN